MLLHLPLVSIQNKSKYEISLQPCLKAIFMKTIILFAQRIISILIIPLWARLLEIILEMCYPKFPSLDNLGQSCLWFLSGLRSDIGRGSSHKRIGVTVLFKLQYIKIHIFIIRCIFSFLFIGREPTMWPANNCLQISVLLQIIFCSCAIEITLLWENGRSVPRCQRMIRHF